MKPLVIWAAGTLALLAACVSPEAEIEKANGICASGGFLKGSAAFQECVSDEVAKAEERRTEVGQAFALGLQSYGSSTQSNAYTYRRQPLHCSSHSLGTSVYTDCY